MKRIHTLARLIGLAAFACLSLGFASKASAELTVCNNHPSQTILYTHIISDAGCVGGKRKQGWAFIAPFTCQNVFPNSMLGKTLYTFAITQNGQGVWDGPVQNNFWTPRPHHNVCHNSAQISCTNPGANCEKLKFRGPFFYQSPSVGITYTPQ
jgi:uncharacterized membrane protein